MATMTKCVCVWLDETSEPSNPEWVVSLDSLDDDGGAVTTETIDTCETKEEAMEEGRRQAKRLGLPLYRNPGNGPAELVEE